MHGWTYLSGRESQAAIIPSAANPFSGGYESGVDTTDGGLKVRLSCGSAEIERLSQRDLSRPARALAMFLLAFQQSIAIKNSISSKQFNFLGLYKPCI